MNNFTIIYGSEYDYGARFYDPVIARWIVVDAYAEHPDQINLSPYAYVANNPIDKTDPDGNCPGPPCDVPAAVQKNPSKPQTLTVDKKALAPHTNTTTDITSNSQFGNSAPAQIVSNAAHNVVSSLTETTTAVHTGTLTDPNTGKVSMVASTNVTATTVSFDATAKVPITGISQTTSTTIEITPVISQTTTTATLNVNGTHIMSLPPQTTSLSVNSKLSTGLQSSLTTAIHDENTGTMNDFYTIGKENNILP